MGFLVYPPQPQPESQDTESPVLPGAWDIFIHDPDQWWAENPLMSFRGEQLHVPTGKDIYIKLSEQIFTSLNRKESPCQETHETISYSEVNCTNVS